MRSSSGISGSGCSTESGPKIENSASWTSASPEFAVTSRRYQPYSVSFPTSNVRGWKRCGKSSSVRVSRSTHVCPSVEPWTFQFFGSRPAESFADVMPYFTSATGCSMRSVSWPVRANVSHLVLGSPSTALAGVSAAGLRPVPVASATFSDVIVAPWIRAPTRPSNHFDADWARAASRTPRKPPPLLMYAWSAASCSPLSSMPSEESMTTPRYSPSVASLSIAGSDVASTSNPFAAPSSVSAAVAATTGSVCSSGAPWNTRTRTAVVAAAVATGAVASAPLEATALLGAVATGWADAGITAALATSATLVRPTVMASSAPGRERPLVGDVDRLDSTLQLLRHRCGAPGRAGSGSCWRVVLVRGEPATRRCWISRRLSGRRAP